MICEQQNPALGLDVVNPLSPPATPGHKVKNFPSNFLTLSPENFCSSIAVTSSTNTTGHNTINATVTGSAVTESDAANLHFSFNIPRFISADLDPCLDKQESGDSQNSHLSLTLPNTWQERHSSTSQSYIHAYPSPVSSPDEIGQSFEALLDEPAAIHSSPVTSPQQQQQPDIEESHFQNHHHRRPHLHHQNSPHLNHLEHSNHPNHLLTNTVQSHSVELPSILNFIKSKDKKLFSDISTSDVDQTIHQPVSFSIQNNSINNNSSNNNRSEVIELDIKDIVTTEVNSTHFSYQKESGPNHFDMSRTDIPTDINNNNNDNNSHNFHAAATTKNKNDSYDYSQEVDNVFLPWTFLMSSCEESTSNTSMSDPNDFFDQINDRKPPFTTYSEQNAIVSDVQMTDNDSSLDCDITDLKDVVDVCPFKLFCPDEWEQFSNIIMSSTASYSSEMPSITEISTIAETTGSISGDDISDGDYNKDIPQQQEFCPGLSNPFFNNSIGDSEPPNSPSNSDEGFVDCIPSFRRDLPIGGKKLPFDGKFPETEESEASSAADSKKRSCKRQSSLKLKRKTAASPPGERRKPGRRPGQVSNVLHLWEFMRDLLHEPKFNGCIIEWISQIEGVFRVLDSAEVARLWGEKKNNKKAMTYEKLSRSLRYSRLEGYFDNLPKDKNYPKKLCFKFGPKSKDWSLMS